MPKYEELFLTIDVNSSEPAERFAKAMEPHKGQRWKIVGIAPAGVSGLFAVMALQRELKNNEFATDLGHVGSGG